jgi:hypothetical protein
MSSAMVAPSRSRQLGQLLKGSGRCSMTRNPPSLLPLSPRLNKGVHLFFVPLQELMTRGAKRDKVNHRVSAAKVPLKVSEGLNVVNVQGAMQTTLGCSTPLAGMPVALTHTAGLPIPVWPVVRIKAASPCRVLHAGHVYLMRDIKALFRAVVMLADCIFFAVKLFSASITCNCNTSKRCPNDTVGLLPCTTALSIAEVMRFNGARRDTLSRSTPCTADDGLRVTACGAAKHWSAPIGVPGGAVHDFAAPGAGYGLPIPATCRRACQATEPSRTLQRAIGWQWAAAVFTHGAYDFRGLVMRYTSSL